MTRRPWSLPVPSDAPHMPARADAPGRARWLGLGIAALLPLAALMLLMHFDVPLGRPGKFVYPYSPITAQRLAAAPWLAIPTAMLAIAVGWWGAALRSVRVASWVALAAGAIGVAAWSVVAPPAFAAQHFFNLRSPSQDGAFFNEAKHVEQVGVVAYLRDFPARAQTPEAEMRGTRVISNPPGATLLALAAQRVSRWPALRKLLLAGVDEPLSPDVQGAVAAALAYGWLLTLLWLLALPALLAAGATVLAPPVALTFALVSWLTPATLLLTPGKDAAQLLSVAVMLGCWLHAWRRDSWIAAAAAGVVFALSCLLSLVHVWVALALVAAALLHPPQGPRWRLAWRQIAPAAIAAVASLVVLYMLTGYDSLSASRAVAAAQARVTRGPDSMPLLWQALGVPLFLLFCGPALWLSVVSRRRRDPDARNSVAFGRSLCLLTAATMLATVGFTNAETPRLWLVFMPPLQFGLCQWREAPSPGGLRRGSVALLLVQVAVSAVCWAMMDMRGAEERLIRPSDGAPRLFG